MQWIYTDTHTHFAPRLLSINSEQYANTTGSEPPTRHRERKCGNFVIPCLYAGYWDHQVGSSEIHSLGHTHGHTRTHILIWGHAHTHTHTRTRTHTHTYMGLCTMFLKTRPMSTKSHCIQLTGQNGPQVWTGVSVV